MHAEVGECGGVEASADLAVGIGLGLIIKTVSVELGGSLVGEGGGAEGGVEEGGVEYASDCFAGLLPGTRPRAVPPAPAGLVVLVLLPEVVEGGSGDDLVGVHLPRAEHPVVGHHCEVDRPEVDDAGVVDDVRIEVVL